MRYRALPGGDLVTTGLCDLECGVESEASLLISIGEPRLRRLGMQVTNPLAGSEHRLYERLAAVDPRAVGKQARAPGAVQEATTYTDVRELLAKQRDLDAIINPAGHELFYRSVKGDMMVARFSASARFTVTSVNRLFTPVSTPGSGGVFLYEVSPDGQRFLMLDFISGRARSTVERVVLVHNFADELRQRLP